MKDRILSYLPENVHVKFGWDKEPWCGRHTYGHIEYKVICIPKDWLKHGKRGAYNEWEIKAAYKKKLVSKFGDEFIHTTEQLEVLEWNQLETVVKILQKAKGIDFDLISYVDRVNPEDAIYMNTVMI